MDGDFDSSAYGPAFAELIGDEPEMALDAGRPDPAMRPSLGAATIDSLFAGHEVANRGAAECCLAAVWLLHGFLDESHAICQNVPSASGSYWHGVMHRREGDYWNAGYWFRQAGDHPAGESIAPVADSDDETAIAARDGWVPCEFVLLVERAVQDGGSLADACRVVQRAEWRALFDYCWREAVGD